MNRNPIIPFVLIMVFGIGLIFFLSFMGLENREERAKGDEGEAGNALAELPPEQIYQKAGCISCHGTNYSDGSAPSLLGLSEKYSAGDIEKILHEGLPGGMPSFKGTIPEEKMAEMAEWLLTLE